MLYHQRGNSGKNGRNYWDMAKQRKDRDKIILATKVAGPGMEYLRDGSRLIKTY